MVHEVHPDGQKRCSVYRASLLPLGFGWWLVSWGDMLKWDYVGQFFSGVSGRAVGARMSRDLAGLHRKLTML